MNASTGNQRLSFIGKKAANIRWQVLSHGLPLGSRFIADEFAALKNCIVARDLVIVRLEQEKKALEKRLKAAEKLVREGAEL